VEIGAYLNTLRSSLDILASVLAIRYNICAPKDAYFPIPKSKAAFGAPASKSKSARFVAGLPPAERGYIIEQLKSYKGGNEDLWSLHQLDIMRKHRRLLTVIAGPEFFSVEGVGIHKYFTPPATGFMRADNAFEREVTAGIVAVLREWGRRAVVLGLMAKDAPPYGMKFGPYVAFDETAITGRKRVIRALHDFAALATTIIKRFDR
jgi:hypothetical protein